MTSWRFWWVCLVTGAMACAERNPEYCGDGTCIDPAKPFCDIDGSFAGKPGTCIAVACTAGEFQKCRDDIAVTCNATGTNFDLLRCEMGCDVEASGCKHCTANAQCSESEVCDPITSHCRGCTADDECDSRVCDLEAATCVPESSILYAAPGAFGTCSLAQPCSLVTAYQKAAAATPIATVRMLPGNYTSPLTAAVATATPVPIVATGASMVVIGQTAAIVVGNGAKLEIRNLSSTSERQVQCGLGDVNAPISAITLRDATLTMVGSALGFEIERCELDLHAVDFTTGDANILATRSDATFKANGFYVRSTAISALIITGSRVTVDVVNSVFDSADIAGFLSDTGPPGTSIKFAYTTFLFGFTADTICNGTDPSVIKVAFENSILAVKGAGDVFASLDGCTFASTLLTRQASPPSGVIIADPKFVDLAARDFHLSSGSPAIDAAIGSSTPDHDLEGTPRPQGIAPDLGAYEFRP